MNPNENLRFEELVSSYLDGSITPELEYELLQMVEHPDYARAFAELTRLDSEIKGVLASPVPDDTMADLVNREINYVEGRSSRRQSKVYQAVMTELTDARRAIIPAHVPPLHVQPKPAERTLFHWTMAISAVLHAAVIALVISLHFSGPRQSQTHLVGELPPVEKKNDDSNIKPAKIPEARLAAVQGEVHNVRDDKREVAVNGIPLDDNDAVETVGKTSSAEIRYLDSTKVELKPDSRLRRMIPQEAYAGSKCIFLEHGSLAASVAPQPKDAPMRLITPNAEATVIGTEFTLTSYPGQTHLDVTEGIVRLTRIADGKTIEVRAGQFAIVADSIELKARQTGSRRFVKGINFFGPAVTIDGLPWMSHEQAMRDGMQLQYNLRGSSSHNVNYTPIPSVDAATRKMMSSRVYSMDDNVGIQVPLPSGTYEFEMWVFETFKPQSRSFDVEVNGVIAQRGVGKLPLYNWVKAGPYRAEVKNGKLDIRIHKMYGNPAISGLCIYSLNGAAAAPRPEPEPADRPADQRIDSKPDAKQD